MSHKASLLNRANDSKWPLDKRRYFIRMAVGEFLNSGKIRDLKSFDEWLKCFDYDKAIDDIGIQDCTNKIIKFFRPII
jgi:hypothetical protein